MLTAMYLLPSNLVPRPTPFSCSYILQAIDKSWVGTDMGTMLIY